MREKGIGKYENAHISREGENANLQVQERSLDCSCWTTKGQDKAGNESVLTQLLLNKTVMV